MQLVLGGVLLAALLAASPADEAAAVYEQGKVFYDRREFHSALEKFDDAARLEPTRARWQYNRGLALRKLGRDAEARAALLESLRLDPEYKVSEIREKLGQLGDTAPPASTPTADATSPAATSSGEELGQQMVGFAVCCGVPGILLVIIIRAVRARKRGAAPTATSQLPRVDTSVLRPQLVTLGQKLSRVEHAISVQEDAEARAHLDRAYTNFAMLKRGVLNQNESLENLKGAIERGTAEADAAETRLRALLGARFDGAKGPKVGCFFCARPLPTDASRFEVPLQSRGAETRVVACKTCARRASAGEAPPVLQVSGAHWSKAPNADPYELTYQEVPTAREAPLGQFVRNQSNVAELAALAGTAVAAGALGSVAMRALDLDSIGESFASAEATAAAARSESSRREPHDWKDHS